MFFFIIRAAHKRKYLLPEDQILSFKSSPYSESDSRHNFKILFMGSLNYNSVLANPASILCKSIAGRSWPVSYPDGPITARFIFM